MPRLPARPALPCRQFNIHWDTLEKMLSQPEPPQQRRPAARPKPKLDPFLSIIHEILTADLQQPKKQRHIAKRIFERPRDEHGFPGKLTIVQEAALILDYKKAIGCFEATMDDPGWQKKFPAMDLVDTRPYRRRREFLHDELEKRREDRTQNDKD